MCFISLPRFLLYVCVYIYIYIYICLFYLVDEAEAADKKPEAKPEDHDEPAEVQYSTFSGIVH